MEKKMNDVIVHFFIEKSLGDLSFGGTLWLGQIWKLMLCFYKKKFR